MRGEMPANQEIWVFHRRCDNSGEYAIFETNFNPLARLFSVRAIVPRRISWIGPVIGLSPWKARDVPRLAYPGGWPDDPEQILDEVLTLGPTMRILY
jgi:hypothetical protein